MADEQKTKLRLEIAHVLFLDIVGYSKLLIDEQSEALQELNQLVRTTEAAREAEGAGQLIILPTGDGMALVFTGSVEEPVECALQISHALRAQPSLPVRMGIHSGPVHHVKDANERENIAGAGINIAQRVMDCGDAGHILVSKRVADDLAQYRRWQPYLHELGDFEVKHGVIVSVANLYADVVGNPEPPAKLKASKRLPRRGPASEQEKNEVWRMIGLPMAYCALGRKADADAALDTLIAKAEKDAVYNIAYVYAFCGDADKAFVWLYKAVTYQDPGLSEIVVENLFDKIHSDPRWLPFLRKIGKAPDQLAKIEFKVPPLPR